MSGRERGRDREREREISGRERERERDIMHLVCSSLREGRKEEEWERGREERREGGGGCGERDSSKEHRGNT